MFSKEKNLKASDSHVRILGKTLAKENLESDFNSINDFDSGINPTKL
jgi:hypothetical protein